MVLDLTPAQVEALRQLLVNTAMEMDDDGQEGAFDASPLRPIYDQVLVLAGAR